MKIPLLPAGEKARQRGYNRTFYKAHRAAVRARHRDWRRQNQAANRYLLNDLRKAQADPSNVKACPICKVTLPLAAYCLDTAMAGGYDLICRECRKSLKRGYAEAKKEREASGQ